MTSLLCLRGPGFWNNVKSYWCNVTDFLNAEKVCIYEHQVSEWLVYDCLKALVRDSVQNHAKQ